MRAEICLLESHSGKTKGKEGRCSASRHDVPRSEGEAGADFSSPSFADCPESNKKDGGSAGSPASPARLE